MDNLQFWLYVIIGVIYLITQVRKKSKEQSLPPKTPVSREKEIETPRWKTTAPSTQAAPKTISFEDLLREITEAKIPKSEPDYQPNTASEYTNYDDDIQAESIDYEEEVTYTYNDPIYKQYEEAKSRDYSSLSLEESMKLENVNMEYGRFKEFESTTNVNLLEQYAQELRDPQGFKKAIILSEILNTKHF
jgi:hypothetical protein